MALFLLIAAASACEPPDVPALMKQVGATIGADEPSKGLDLLDAAWNRLPEACSVSTRDLALIADRAGALAWDLQKESLSEMWFEKAATVAPNEPFPASLGPTAEGRWRVAKEAVGGRSQGTLHAEQDLVVDGVAHPAGETFSLVVGVHLVTWGTPPSGRWATVDNAGAVGLPSGNLWVDTPTSDPERRWVPVALVGSGVGVAALGAVLLGVVLPGAYYQQQCYRSVDASMGDCASSAGAPVARPYYGGLALVTAGSALGVAGLGLGAHLALSPSSTQVELSGSF